jgi:hypothetical protein
MNNKTITLSRELAELCYRALNGGDNQLTGMEHGRAFRELRAAMAEPVPPAGGEPLPSRPYASEEDQSSMTDYEIGLGHGGCEMWDKFQPHVTRLQAEVERLKLDQKTLTDANHRQAMCIHHTAQSMGPEIAATVDALPKAAKHLQSELTKARELLTDICDTAYIQSSEGADAYGAAREYLAEQRGKS